MAYSRFPTDSTLIQPSRQVQATHRSNHDALLVVKSGQLTDVTMVLRARRRTYVSFRPGQVGNMAYLLPASADSAAAAALPLAACFALTDAVRTRNAFFRRVSPLPTHKWLVTQ